MGAGSFVFPVVMVGFVIGFSGWLMSAPVTPNLRVEPGDIVHIDFTQYYGDGTVFFTTVQAVAGDASIPKAPDFAQGEARNVTIPRLPEGQALTGPLLEMLGRPIGDEFVTPRYSDVYGQYDRQSQLPPLRFAIPRDQTVADFEPTAFPVTFSQLRQDAGAPLAVGAKVDCLHPGWKCTVMSLNLTGSHAEVRIEAPTGQVLNLTQVQRLHGYFYDGVRHADRPFEVTSNGTHVLLEMKLQRGDSFISRVPATSWPAGAYRIGDVVGETHSVSYAPVDRVVSPGGLLPEPYLVGQPVWYKIKINSINRPAPVSQGLGAPSA